MVGDSRAQGSWAELESGGGMSGQSMLATAFGWRTAHAVQIGDRLRTWAGGTVAVVSIRSTSVQEWICIPPLALGNRHAVVVGQGQNLLIESHFALDMMGSAAVALPALALRHWRGISPCAAPARSLRLTVSRPALVMGETGIMLAVDGPANHAQGVDLAFGGDLPPVPNLSLTSAQHLIACLMAYDAGVTLRGLRPQAAVF